MGIDSLATGDNWHEPYVSGHDVLYERIIEDYEMYPQEYEEWEKEILDQNPHQRTNEDEKRLLEYMEEWFKDQRESESW